MSKSSRIQRNYHGSDAKMLAFCSVILAQFEAHIDDFTAFDPNFNPAYVLLFSATINQAGDRLPNTQEVAITSQHTDNLRGKLIEARNAFLMQKFFINKAFPNNAAIGIEFGYNNYNACRNSSEKMFQFLTELHQTSIKYGTELAAVGFGATHLAALAGIKDQLQTLITNQQLSIGQRATLTTQRIELLNNARSMCRTVCNAGKIVYSADYGMYQCFLEPRRKSKKKVIANPEEV